MNYEQSNVGPGMVPCRKGCRCADCTIERLQARVEVLETAIEFAFNNAANSFIGVNFSFEAVKKLRAATEQGESDE